MTDAGSLWIVLPIGQQAAGAWIDEVLGRHTAAVPRQRIEVVRGPRVEDRLQELFLRRGWSDGLPIVPPTLARVKEALDFAGRRPTESLGEVEPLKGLATVEKIAANAVMAGCRPEYLPVVLTAVECLLDAAFNLRGVQTTDENVTPLVVVNGPVVSELGINGSFGALGPGWQANATIGRAVRLVMHNIGGGRPGAVGFAGLGQPGRYTLCLAENEAKSPWVPLHVETGMAAEASAVTLTRAESVINVTGGLAEIASVMGSAASGFGILWSGRPTVLIAPAVAAECGRRRMSKDDVRQFLWQHGRWRNDDWRNSWLAKRIVADGRWPEWVEEAAKTGDIPAVRAPDDIVLVVAGGDIPIPQNAYCPTWGFPPARITREVCLPRDWQELLADARETAEAFVAD